MKKYFMMNEYYNEIDWLPPIPNNLILSIEDIFKLKNSFKYPEVFERYATFQAQESLCNFVSSYFNYDVNVKYQVIRKELPIHTDSIKSGAKGGVKYNYIVETGGDNVITRWWDKTHKNMLYEIKCPQKTWHELRIDIPHNVTTPSSPRLTIVARKREKK